MLRQGTSRVLGLVLRQGAQTQTLEAQQQALGALTQQFR